MADDIGIGRLREVVTLQRATVTRGDFNEEILTWATVATLRAKVTERGGREPLAADRPVMVVSYEVEVRKGVTVTHKDRLLWRGLTLAVDVVTPRPEIERQVLRCVAVEN